MNLDLWFYWKLLLRRLPVMMLFVLIFLGLGVITALKQPETWATSAQLLLQDPQIQDSLNGQTAELEQLDIIRQKLMTRANLIDIANRYKVFEDMARMDPDEVYLQMRAASSIRSFAGRDRATTLRIRFEARSGQIAANVVNELVTLVLAESSSARRARVDSALGFFEQEVDQLKEELDLKSVEIARFKSDNADALPSDQRYRSDRLNRLEERLGQINRDLRAIEVRRVEVTEIYENTGRIEDSRSQARQLSPQEQRLAATQEQLTNAQIVQGLSETHPNVVRLKAIIERLEQEIAQKTDAVVGTTEDTKDTERALTAQDIMFQSTMTDLDARTEVLVNEAERVQQEVVMLQEASISSASNGITLATLELDRENIQRRYNNALNKLNAAQFSERIEDRAQGQRISVVESASVPTNPTGPNRTLIAGTGGVIGVALAAAYFVLLELLNRSIRRPEEMLQKFNITPITVVPYLESVAHRRMRRGLRVVAFITVVITVPVTLWYIDTNYLPLDLVVQRGLARLGLG